jgi:hypothetical protein
MTIAETVEYKGHTIEVHYDEFGESPRGLECALGTMLCFHRNYALGDKHNFSASDFEGWDDMKDYLYRREDAVVVLPLYLYDHGGITMRTGPFACQWDSGQVGFIFISKETLLKEYGSDTEETRKTAERVLRGEVETYDRYLTGQVYGFTVEGPDCNDSCWGLYEDVDYVVEEAKGYIDAALRHTQKQKEVSA